MISKERLEELIKQGATIYTTYGGYISEINLHNKYDYVTDNYLFEADMVAGEVGYRKYPFNMLFETEEDAKWFAEFGCVERTEKLELPTWEMFDEEKSVWFVDKSQNQCCLYYLNVANKIFIIVSGEVIEIGDFTKENYTIACRKAKEVFLGEKK